MSKIIVIIGSVRKGGNTELLANEFVKGAGEKNEVEVISVSDFKIKPCIGCNSCFKREGNDCVQDDDMNQIYEKLKNADAIVAASPVYFYGISAQLKALVDRLRTPLRNEFHIKKLGLILVGAATLPDLFDPIILQYKMILRFFDLEDGGMVLVPGAREKGDVIGKDGMREAYNLGVLF